MTNDPTYDPTAEFTLTRTLDAPRKLVWRAWTETEHLVAWFHPTGVSLADGSTEFDAREGGRYRYTMVNEETGETFPTGGTYLEVVPPERLVFTWGEPGAPVDRAPVITVTLREADGGTALTFHLRGFAGRPGDGFVYDGWDEALDNLAAHVEGR